MGPRTAATDAFPARYDPWFGGRLGKRPVYGALLRALYRIADGGDSLSLEQVRGAAEADSRVSPHVTRTSNWVRVSLQCLRDAGLVTLAGSHKQRTVTLVALPDMAVPIATDLGSIRSILVWLAMKARADARQGTRADALIRSADVTTYLSQSRDASDGPLWRADEDGANAKYERETIRKLARRAMRELVAVAPENWALAVDPLSGSGVFFCLIDAQIGHVANGSTDCGTQTPGAESNARVVTPSAARSAVALLRALEARALEADPPMVCLNDFSQGELATMFPRAARPLKSAGSALIQLIRPRQRGLVGPLVLDLGVFKGRRYVTLRAMRADGERALRLMRWDAQLDIVAETIRGYRACRVHAVQREGAEAGAAMLETLRRFVDAVPDADVSLWTVHMHGRLRQRAATYEQALTRATKTSGTELRWSGALSPTTRVMLSSAQVHAEAEAATPVWRPGRRPWPRLGESAKAHVRREEMVDDADTASRVGHAGRFPGLAVRAYLLTQIADPYTARVARFAVARLGQSPSHSALLSGLGECAATARWAACAGLGLVGDVDAVAPLSAVARGDTEAGVREIAFWALALLCPDTALTLVKRDHVLAPQCRERIQSLAEARRERPVSWQVPLTDAESGGGEG